MGDPVTAELLDRIGYDHGEPWCVIHDTRASVFDANEPVSCERPNRAPYAGVTCVFRPLLVPVQQVVVARMTDVE